MVARLCGQHMTTLSILKTVCQLTATLVDVTWRGNSETTPTFVYASEAATTICGLKIKPGCPVVYAASTDDFIFATYVGRTNAQEFRVALLPTRTRDDFPASRLCHGYGEVVSQKGAFVKGTLIVQTKHVYPDYLRSQTLSINHQLDPPSLSQYCFTGHAFAASRRELHAHDLRALTHTGSELSSTSCQVCGPTCQGSSACLSKCHRPNRDKLEEMWQSTHMAYVSNRHWTISMVASAGARAFPAMRDDTRGLLDQLSTGYQGELLEMDLSHNASWWMARFQQSISNRPLPTAAHRAFLPYACQFLAAIFGYYRDTSRFDRRRSLTRVPSPFLPSNYAGSQSSSIGSLTSLQIRHGKDRLIDSHTRRRALPVRVTSRTPQSPPAPRQPPKKIQRRLQVHTLPTSEQIEKPVFNFPKKRIFPVHGKLDNDKLDTKQWGSLKHRFGVLAVRTPHALAFFEYGKDIENQTIALPDWLKGVWVAVVVAQGQHDLHIPEFRHPDNRPLPLRVDRIEEVMAKTFQFCAGYVIGLVKFATATPHQVQRSPYSKWCAVSRNFKWKVVDKVMLHPNDFIRLRHSPNLQAIRVYSRADNDALRDALQFALTLRRHCDKAFVQLDVTLAKYGLEGHQKAGGLVVAHLVTVSKVPFAKPSYQQSYVALIFGISERDGTKEQQFTLRYTFGDVSWGIDDDGRLHWTDRAGNTHRLDFQDDSQKAVWQRVVRQCTGFHAKWSKALSPRTRKMTRSLPRKERCPKCGKDLYKLSDHKCSPKSSKAKEARVPPPPASDSSSEFSAFREGASPPQPGANDGPMNVSISPDVNSGRPTRTIRASGHPAHLQARAQRKAARQARALQGDEFRLIDSSGDFESPNGNQQSGDALVGLFQLPDPKASEIVYAASPLFTANWCLPQWAENRHLAVVVADTKDPSLPQYYARANAQHKGHVIGFLKLQMDSHDNSHGYKYNVTDLLPLHPQRQVLCPQVASDRPTKIEGHTLTEAYQRACTRGELCSARVLKDQNARLPYSSSAQSDRWVWVVLDPPGMPYAHRNPSTTLSFELWEQPIEGRPHSKLEHVTLRHGQKVECVQRGDDPWTLTWADADGSKKLSFWAGDDVPKQLKSILDDWSTFYSVIQTDSSKEQSQSPHATLPSLASLSPPHSSTLAEAPPSGHSSDGSDCEAEDDGDVEMDESKRKAKREKRGVKRSAKEMKHTDGPPQGSSNFDLHSQSVTPPPAPVKTARSLEEPLPALSNSTIPLLTVIPPPAPVKIEVSPPPVGLAGLTVPFQPPLVDKSDDAPIKTEGTFTKPSDSWAPTWPCTRPQIFQFFDRSNALDRWNKMCGSAETIMAIVHAVAQRESAASPFCIFLEQKFLPRCRIDQRLLDSKWKKYADWTALAREQNKTWALWRNLLLCEETEDQDNAFARKARDAFRTVNKRISESCSVEEAFDPGAAPKHAFDPDWDIPRRHSKRRRTSKQPPPKPSSTEYAFWVIFALFCGKKLKIALGDWVLPGQLLSLAKGMLPAKTSEACNALEKYHWDQRDFHHCKSHLQGRVEPTGKQCLHAAILIRQCVGGGVSKASTISLTTFWRQFFVPYCHWQSEGRFQVFNQVMHHSKQAHATLRGEGHFHSISSHFLQGRPQSQDVPSDSAITHDTSTPKMGCVFWHDGATGVNSHEVAVLFIPSCNGSTRRWTFGQWDANGSTAKSVIPGRSFCSFWERQRRAGFLFDGVSGCPAKKKQNARRQFTDHFARLSDQCYNTEVLLDGKRKALCAETSFFFGIAMAHWLRSHHVNAKMKSLCTQLGGTKAHEQRSECVTSTLQTSLSEHLAQELITLRRLAEQTYVEEI